MKCIEVPFSRQTNSYLKQFSTGFSASLSLDNGGHSCEHVGHVEADNVYSNLEQNRSPKILPLDDRSIIADTAVSCTSSGNVYAGKHPPGFERELSRIHLADFFGIHQSAHYAQLQV